MSESTEKSNQKSGMPWWGWLIIGVVGLAMIGNLFGNDDVSQPDAVEQGAEVIIEQDEVAAEGDTEAAGSGLCDASGNLFIVRAEDGCIEPWPLTSSSGILYCNPFGEKIGAVVYQPDEDPSVYYAVNGAAQGAGYPEIDLIWEDDPERPGSKINIGKLIDAGLALCGG
jgi:hypothetical protein